uniref:Uncharacterized protein n=1 Tax=Salvator merianae TaxID=96440 RepID=A0A8D0EAY4_SALMN
FEAVRPQMSHPLEQYKPEEDLQNGKAKFEKSAIADKVQGESEEIWLLKQQIAGLQDEFRRNETHWHAAHGELKNQVETLTKQNLELQEELRISELQRIDVERQHGIWPPVSFSDTNTNLMGKKNPLRAQSDMVLNLHLSNKCMDQNVAHFWTTQNEFQK